MAELAAILQRAIASRQAAAGSEGHLNDDLTTWASFTEVPLSQNDMLGAAVALDGRSMLEIYRGAEKPDVARESLIYLTPPWGQNGDEQLTEEGPPAFAEWRLHVATEDAASGVPYAASRGQPVRALDWDAAESLVASGIHRLRRALGVLPGAVSLHSRAAVTHAARWLPGDRNAAPSALMLAIDRLCKRCLLSWLDEPASSYWGSPIAARRSLRVSHEFLAAFPQPS